MPRKSKKLSLKIGTDLIEAKQTLSARLLKAAYREKVSGLKYAISVNAAIANAGKNTHAVGIGKKIVNGKTTNVIAIRIYVVQKLAPSLIPPKDLLPAMIDGIPTDIIESPPAFFNAKSANAIASTTSCSIKKRQVQRPIIAGISTSHFKTTAGTIACFCKSVKAGDNPNDVYILSNNHVLSNINNAQAGDDIFQPGIADGGTVQNHIAELQRFVPLQFGEDASNDVDGAIAKLLPGVKQKNEICSIGAVNGIDGGAVNMTVCKHGRTSCYTEGIITDASVDSLVIMNDTTGVAAKFTSQMRVDKIDPFSVFGIPGDSGSLVLNKSNKSAIGLYFAGPSGGEYGLVNYIFNVMTELEIELL